MIDLQKLVRTNILNLKPYSSARDEFTGEALVFLDANENPFNQPFNRYPDPLQKVLKKRVSEIKNLRVGQIFTGNGSDEPIDLLIRAFCEPGRDKMITIDPTYGMYQVAADINDVQVIKSPLTPEFQLEPINLLSLADENTKIVFLCSPNNPTGNCLDKDSIIEVVGKFQGIVVLDEAYIDFSPENSLLPRLGEYPNLVILQTLSKAWGLAGIRLGMAFACESIISVLNRIKYPYNINILTQQKATEILNEETEKDEWVRSILLERKRMEYALRGLSFVKRIYPSDANFLLIKMENPGEIYDYLIANGIVVRDRSKALSCEGSLRITIGTTAENDLILNALNNFK